MTVLKSIEKFDFLMVQKTYQTLSLLDIIATLCGMRMNKFYFIGLTVLFLLLLMLASHLFDFSSSSVIPSEVRNAFLSLVMIE